jgi:hypothetical protein
MSADHNKQIGIWGGARSFQLRGGSIKQNENYERSQELKDRSEKFKTSSDSFGSWTYFPWPYLANFFVRLSL